MKTVYITRPLTDFLDDFAGRKDTPGYDESHIYKIAECNRDFVWPLEYQQSLIESVLKSAPIPTIAICNNEIVDGGNRSTTLHQFVNNQFKVTIDGVEYDYDGVRGNSELNNKWLSCQVNLMVITGATLDQFADIYENLNKGIRLTHGQLMVNRTHFPLVYMVLAMIGRIKDVQLPWIGLLHRAWKDTFNTTKGRGEVTLAFQILASALFGPEHFHAYFLKHSKLFHEKSQADINSKIDNIVQILTMINSVDPENTINRKIKAEVFRKFIGAIIYDFHNLDDYNAKWSTFIQNAYKDLTTNQLKQLVFVGSKRSHATLRCVGVSENVREYIAGRFEFKNESVSDQDDGSEE
jgi:hypothetical protein